MPRDACELARRLARDAEVPPLPVQRAAPGSPHRRFDRVQDGHQRLKAEWSCSDNEPRILLFEGQHHAMLVRVCNSNENKPKAAACTQTPTNANRVSPKLRMPGTLCESSAQYEVSLLKAANRANKASSWITSSSLENSSSECVSGAKRAKTNAIAGIGPSKHGRERQGYRT
jgi:hypothetical protein